MFDYSKMQNEAICYNEISIGKTWFPLNIRFAFLEIRRTFCRTPKKSAITESCRRPFSAEKSKFSGLRARKRLSVRRETLSSASPLYSAAVRHVHRSALSDNRIRASRIKRGILLKRARQLLHFDPLFARRGRARGTCVAWIREPRTQWRNKKKKKKKKESNVPSYYRRFNCSSKPFHSSIDSSVFLRRAGSRAIRKKASAAFSGNFSAIVARRARRFKQSCEETERRKRERYRHEVSRNSLRIGTATRWRKKFLALLVLPYYEWPVVESRGGCFCISLEAARRPMNGSVTPWKPSRHPV